MRHASYFGRTDWCGRVVSSLDTVSALWKLCLCSIAPAWLNMPEPSCSERLSPSQFSWWNVPPEAELSHSPLSLRFAHRHLSSLEITSCRSLPNKHTLFNHQRAASCATSMHIQGLKLTADTTQTLPVPEELCGMTLVGAILWRDSLGSSAATRAKRQIMKLQLTIVHLQSLCPHCLYAAGSSSLRLRNSSVVSGNSQLPVWVLHNKYFIRGWVRSLSMYIHRIGVRFLSNWLNILIIKIF